MASSRPTISVSGGKRTGRSIITSLLGKTTCALARPTIPSRSITSHMSAESFLIISSHNDANPERNSRS